MKTVTKNKKDELLKFVTDHFFKSGDFNGTHWRSAADALEIDIEGIRKLTKQLVRSGLMDVVFGDRHPNPYIRALKVYSAKAQLEKINDKIFENHSCLYPSKMHLNTIVDKLKYADRPFTLCRAFGEPDLEIKPFDLSILEFYRNDPRYYYANDDISGWIGVKDKHYGSRSMKNSDKIFLKSFGFCYDKNWNRAVAVYTVYLSGLSPEHQHVWKAKLLTGKFRVHPEYYLRTAGYWPDRMPISEAFIEEIRVINQMCRAMKKPEIFHNCFPAGKPKEFGFLVRPTLNEFNAFNLLFDKMISDNINKKFFSGDVLFEYEVLRKDGKIEIKHKGTITLLDEWVRKHFRTQDSKPLNDMLSIFREVRNLRQKPAHAVNENEYDQKYFKMQRNILVKAYTGIRTLRMLLANHPKVNMENIEISDFLKEGKICDY